MVSTRLIAKDLKLMSQVTISNLFSKCKFVHFENKLQFVFFSKSFVFLLELVIIDRLSGKEE